MFKNFLNKNKLMLKVILIIGLLLAVVYLYVKCMKSSSETFSDECPCADELNNIEGYVSFESGATFKFEKDTIDDKEIYYLHYSLTDNKVIGIDLENNNTLVPVIKGDDTKQKDDNTKLRYKQHFTRLELTTDGATSYYTPKRFLFYIKLEDNKNYGLVFEHGFLSVRPLKTPVSNNKFNEHYIGNVFTLFTGEKKELDSHMIDIKFNPVSLRPYYESDIQLPSQSGSLMTTQLDQQQGQVSDEQKLNDLTLAQYKDVLTTALSGLASTQGTLNSPTTNPMFGSDQRLKINLNLSKLASDSDTFVDDNSGSTRNDLRRLIEQAEQNISPNNTDVTQLLANMNKVDDLESIPGLSNKFESVCDANLNMKDLIPANLMSRCYGCSTTQDDTFFKSN